MASVGPAGIQPRAAPRSSRFDRLATALSPRRATHTPHQTSDLSSPAPASPSERLRAEAIGRALRPRAPTRRAETAADIADARSAHGPPRRGPESLAVAYPVHASLRPDRYKGRGAASARSVEPTTTPA